MSVFKGKSRKASLSSQCLKNKLKGRRKGEQHSGSGCWGRAFQAEGTASTKALGHWGLDLCEAKSVLFLVTSPATGMAAGI